MRRCAKAVRLMLRTCQWSSKSYSSIVEVASWMGTSGLIYCRCLSSIVANIWAGFDPTFQIHPLARYWLYVIFIYSFLIESSHYSNRICSLCFPGSCPNACSRRLPNLKHSDSPAHTRKLATDEKHSWFSPATENHTHTRDSAHMFAKLDRCHSWSSKVSS